MNIKFIAIPAIALAAVISLAACGTQAPGPAATVIAAPAPTAPAATPPAAAASAPQIIINNNNNQQPAPAQTVYVHAPAAPVAGGLTACGSGVSAGASTSCLFASNVEQAYTAGGYWNQPGTSYFTVDGQFMTSASVGNPVTVTDGSGDLVQFNY
jgi:hypothetical protein